jgi:hypothetical protein
MKDHDGIRYGVSCKMLINYCRILFSVELNTRGFYTPEHK